MKKRFSTATLIITCIASVTLTVLGVAAVFVFQYGGLDSFNSASKYAAIYNAIENDFVGDADMEKVSNAAFSAMIDTIDDRWSYYMTAAQYVEYQKYQQNSYSGIGITIELDKDNNLYKVVTVLEDSPANLAGVNIGDLVCEFDGQDLTGRTSAEVKELISSKQDEPFELKLRAQDGTERVVTVSTELIYTKPVEYEMLDDGIGYIKIKNFETDSGEEIIAAVDKLNSEGAKGIVFDVRNNPGGLLSELLKALDHLLPEGDVFVSADKAGNETVKTSDPECVKIPMTVLMNENSYSAAEFFAAALSEYDWATTVGAHTTGKARSQINILLIDGSAVHLSTNSYLTPKRVDLAEKGGLAPDVAVAIGEDDEAKLESGLLEHDEDPQLIAAVDKIEALNGKYSN